MNWRFGARDLVIPGMAAFPPVPPIQAPGSEKQTKFVKQSDVSV